MRTLASPKWLMPARTRVFLYTLAAKFSGREWHTQESAVQQKEDQEYRRGGDHKREVGSDTTFERSARDGNRGSSKIVSDVLFSP